MPRNLNFSFFNKIKSQSCPQPSLQTNRRTLQFPNHSSSSSSTPLYIKNYNSLYDFNTAATASVASDHHSASDSDSDAGRTPDFASAFASQRFFFSSPGRSNSIIDSSSLASTSSSSYVTSNPLEKDAVSGGGIAVPTYSRDPYMDFRQSMQEMVEARELNDVREQWEYLHELLMCYLSLNPKSTHKFIVGAFADLLVGLMTSPISGRRNTHLSTGKQKIP